MKAAIVAEEVLAEGDIFELSEPLVVGDPLTAGRTNVELPDSVTLRVFDIRPEHEIGGIGHLVTVIHNDGSWSYPQIKMGDAMRAKFRHFIPAARRAS